MKVVVSLVVMVVVVLNVSEVLSQKDVIECFNLYNDQHAKLSSMKDEQEQQEYDCEAQKVQVECLVRVYEVSDKELKPCVELKVNEARKAYLLKCDGCRATSWPLLVLVPLLLTSLQRYNYAPS